MTANLAAFFLVYASITPFLLATIVNYFDDSFILAD
jgi:hypothetical protein